MAATKRARRSRCAADAPGAPGATSPAETLAEAAQRLAELLGPELTALLDAPAAGPERDAPLWRAEAVASVFAQNRDRLALLHALAQRASAAYTTLLAGIFEQAEAHVPDEHLEDAGKELTRETTLLFGLTPKRTEVLLELGLARTRFPKLHEAHARGLLETRHVEAFLRGVGGVALSEQQERQLDAELTPLAVEHRWTSNRLERETRTLTEELTNTDTTQRLRNAVARRQVTICDVGSGMSVFKVFAPSPIVHGIYRRLTRLATELVDQDRNTWEQARAHAQKHHTKEQDTKEQGARRVPVVRTVDQARVDVHTQILLAADPLQVAQNPERVQARISFTIPVLSLTDEAEQLAHTDPAEPADPGETGEPGERQTLDGPVGPGRAGDTDAGAGDAEAPVSALVAAAMAGLPAEARHAVRINAAGHATLDGTGAIDLPTALALLPCSPEIQRIFTHPITGSVLAVDRYTPGPALRRLLTARDGHCRYPGCQRQAEDCDANHTTPHRQGGPTANSNLALLCRHHHRAKHSPGYQLKQLEDGELEWITPAGQRLVDLPERTHLPGTLRRRVIFQPSDTRPGTINPDLVTEPTPRGRGADWGVAEEPNWNDPAVRTTYLRTYDPLGNIRPEYTPPPPPKPDPEPDPDPDPDPELDEPPF